MLKRKMIKQELENLYVLRMQDYQEMLKKGEFEEASRAYNDALKALQQLEDFGHKSKGLMIEAGKAGASLAMTAVQTGVTVNMANKVSKFEESGTWTTTGGRALASDTMKRLMTLPKIK